MRKLSLAVLLLALTACGGATAGISNDSTGVAPSTAVSSVPSTAPEASAPVAEASPAASISNISGDFTNGDASNSAAVEAQAMSRLAAQINQPSDSLKLVSKEATEWSDSSLGCPDPATMYMQVLVSGFKLTYNDGTRDYNVHTDDTGQRAVWCDNGQPKEIAQP